MRQLLQSNGSASGPKAVKARAKNIRPHNGPKNASPCPKEADPAVVQEQRRAPSLDAGSPGVPNAAEACAPKRHTPHQSVKWVRALAQTGEHPSRPKAAEALAPKWQRPRRRPSAGRLCPKAAKAPTPKR